MNFKTHHITSILFGLFATLNTSIGIQAQTIPAGAKDSLVSLAGFLDNPVAEERVQSLLEARDNEKSLDGVVKAATKLGLLLDRKTYSLQQVRDYGGPAILRLSNPEQLVVLTGIGPSYAALYDKGHVDVVDYETLSSRYTKEALILGGLQNAQATLTFDSAVNVQKVAASGEEVSHKISFDNRGKYPLTINVERTSCGCTSAELSTKVLEPGQSGSIIVKMKTGGWGAKTETITLRTSDPMLSRYLLVLQAQMPKTIVPNPSQLAFDVAEGQGENRALWLLLPDKVSVTKISTEHGVVLAQLKESETVEGGTLQHIGVTLKGNIPVGQVTDAIILDINDAEVPQVRVPVEATINSDISITPRQVFLGQVQSGKTIRKTIVVQSQREKPFLIKSIKSENPLIVAKVDSNVTGAVHTVEISITVQGSVGTLVQESVQVVLSTGRTFEVPIIGMVNKRASEDG